MARKQTQEDIVLHHLQNIGPLSQMDAAHKYNIWRLAAVVYLLRRKHIINRSIVPHRSGRGGYAVYRLEGGLGSPQNTMHVALPKHDISPGNRAKASLTLDQLRKELD